jgi:hypothetical protein
MIRKLKYTLQNLQWIKALWSPFKPFTVKWYIGKTQIGIPYFLPRKWVKATPELRTKAVLDKIKSEENYNKLNPNSARKIKSFDELYEEYKNYTFPIPLKVGFSYCGLGWKTKWTPTDFRYEWGPVFSFVFFGYQIALMIGHRDVNHYWEAWLYYEYATDKTKSKRKRVRQCRKRCPQTWTTHRHDEEPKTVDYYTKILKLKYLK